LHDARKARKTKTAAIGSRLAKFVESLPAGSGGYVLLTRSLEQTKKGGIAVNYNLSGTPKMLAEFQKHVEAVVAAHDDPDPDDDPEPPASEYLIMPATAENRASKLRGILHELWDRHVTGTAWAGTKQMFNQVATHGAPKFEWWDGVTGEAEFTFKTVNDPEMSSKIYAHAAPLLVEMLRARPPAPPEPEPIPDPCRREGDWCSNRAGHRGKCNTRNRPAEAEELPPAEP